MTSTWKNFKDMLDDIKSYLESNSNMTIIQNDNPMKLLIGYRCEQSGKEWNINLKDLKNADQDSILLKSLQTQQGKDNLLKAINS